MRSRVSAGLLLYRLRKRNLEVFLAHPGGPFFSRKDMGHWTIPKGEIEPQEEPLAAAIREFSEEIGLSIDPGSAFLELGSIVQKGGKTVFAWAVARDCDDPIECKSNFYRLEWPTRSGKYQSFPEVDRAQFFTMEEARRRIKDTQIPFLDRLEQALKEKGQLL